MPEFIKQITTEQWEALSWARQRANEGKPAIIKQVVDGEEVDVPNPAIITSDNTYLDARMNDVLDSYVAQKHAAENTTAPVPAPAPAPGGVPQTVIRKKALRAMIDKGVLGAVKDFIAALPEPDRSLYQLELDEAKTFGRTHPFVLGAAQGLGWSSAFLDELFVYADALPDF